jgi:hypothetical protein
MTEPTKPTNAGLNSGRWQQPPRAGDTVPALPLDAEASDEGDVDPDFIVQTELDESADDAHTEEV